MATHFKAKVKRMFVSTAGCNVRLEGKGSGYFQLPITHANYNAIYALILTAAANRFDLLIRVKGEREDVADDDAGVAEVSYAVIDW